MLSHNIKYNNITIISIYNTFLKRLYYAHALHMYVHGTSAVLSVWVRV